ncbi:hypothetical protein HU755_21010 [Pseudomonas sp. SWRI111]|uniref:hypothetical protein n=1 Tax=Pseudomonas sp. SWRI111 TaxID=2745507 RepID=UPI00164748B2|nr:hypothetical protein [Pseudomonas sp. SWRI111]MBC3209289.1 hypothetical protein [Pseudomonas sp. SWRI111]
MKGEKATGASTKLHGSSTMSDFFRHGSAEERREIYHMAARAAIDEQKDVILSTKSGEFMAAKCK